MKTVKQPWERINAFARSIKTVADRVYAERDRTRPSIMTERKLHSVMDAFCFAEPHEGLCNGAEISHPKEIEVPQTGSVEVAFPESINRLLAHSSCIAGEALNGAEVAVSELPVFGTKGAKDNASGTKEGFHCS